jgi:hypothetical protein
MPKPEIILDGVYEQVCGHRPIVENSPPGNMPCTWALVKQRHQDFSL